MRAIIVLRQNSCFNSTRQEKYRNSNIKYHNQEQQNAGYREKNKIITNNQQAATTTDNRFDKLPIILANNIDSKALAIYPNSAYATIIL